MIIKKHPFNDKIEKTLFTKDTTSIILGSFPPNDLTAFDKNSKNIRCNYYYGTKRNRFWTIIKLAFNLDASFDTDENKICSFLSEKNYAIIDIIRKCYRLNDISSSDNDLAIIELENIPLILTKYSKINKIITTSRFVRNILVSWQLKPLLTSPKKILKKTRNSIVYEELQFNTTRTIKIFILQSPSGRNQRYSIEKLVKLYKDII